MIDLIKPKTIINGKKREMQKEKGILKRKIINDDEIKGDVKAFILLHFCQFAKVGVYVDFVHFITNHTHYVTATKAILSSGIC